MEDQMSKATERALAKEDELSEFVAEDRKADGDELEAELEKLGF